MVRRNRNISESWQKLPWKKFRRGLFRLQKRVFKAVQAGDRRKAKSLQKLILKSRAARFLAIRQVTQLNAGKKTAGIDGKTALKHEERFELEVLLREKNWYHNKLREIPIPKKDGSIRMLKVPTIADRAWQCLAKYALEPAHEANFHEYSYGFRTGRSAHDAQQQVFNNLNSRTNGIQKRILELDIEKCFDRISHSTIMENLIAPRALKEGIFRALKAGINPEFPEQGTPQGGVVSPLLANIALNGIENLHQHHASGKSKKIKKNTPEKYRIKSCVRYADDMVFFLRPEDDENELLEKINQFLAERGMRISEKKTKVTASTDGFDFLGWNFRVQKNGKLRCTPSEENFKAFRKKVKKIVNCSNYGAKAKARKLAPIVRGWKQYHKYCDMKGSRFSLWFLSHRTFKVFNKETKQDRYSTKKLVNQAFPEVSYTQFGHVKVKGNKSPFDGDLSYWSERNSKLYDGETSKQLKRQNHTCGHCGLKFTSDERVHLHHKDGNHDNWKRDNLTVVHESCHNYIHMGQRKRQNGVK
ncbi:MAG: reverse transcriptase domain-containing protein [Scytonema sp. PMC 1069.18]|nr:reverse transcriptase domain-containing protein [Scytonema sp. PMC 1069.18]MEC4885103.1 reverse transcriptase domain-containing protein [Scytonema sp. PMC 1070.18]